MAMMVISSLVNRTKRRVIATAHSLERCSALTKNEKTEIYTFDFIGDLGIAYGLD